MTEMKIGMRKQPAEFSPGEKIDGAAQWLLERAPTAVEVRLLWHTRGRGTEDVSVAETVRFDAPLRDETRSFSVVAPGAPYSFSGKLITLEWALELVALPSEENARVDIVIAPDGKSINLLEQSLDEKIAD